MCVFFFFFYDGFCVFSMIDRTELVSTSKYKARSFYLLDYVFHRSSTSGEISVFK